MGFLRQQQVAMAMRLLAWQYEKSDRPLPATDQLRLQADRLVDEAHSIARQRGENVLAILKRMVAEAMRR